jgi:competence protein ComEA
VSSAAKQKRIMIKRQWQHHLLRLLLFFSIAGAVSIIWSLLEPPENQIWPMTALPSGALPQSTSVIDAQPAGKNQQSIATAAKQPKVSSEEQIPVYLVGAVVRPGVYIVNRGIYLYELVELAGGLAPEAAAASINLAMRISENQMVKIPTKVEAEDETTLDDLLIGAAPSSAININTANLAKLEELPGVGPATAAAIIADRTKNGPYRRTEDLMRVPGIKESRYVLLENLITVG